MQTKTNCKKREREKSVVGVRDEAKTKQRTHIQVCPPENPSEEVSCREQEEQNTHILLHHHRHRHHHHRSSCCLFSETKEATTIDRRKGINRRETDRNKPSTANRKKNKQRTRKHNSAKSLLSFQKGQTSGKKEDRKMVLLTDSPIHTHT